MLEGIHCTYYLAKNQLIDRKVIVRLHNVEFEYYNHLYKTEPDYFKKIFFKRESKLLKGYENKLAKRARFLSVSEKDENVYKKLFNAKEINYLPVFMPFTSVNSLPGQGEYCLYQGNLSVAENEKAVRWLLENVFMQSMPIPFIVAGKNASKSLKTFIAQYDNVKLIDNPDEEEMNSLIRLAHIHILPSFNDTGVKIKLLNALFNGRFIITNFVSIEDTTFGNLCSIAESPEEIKNAILDLCTQEFSMQMIDKRRNILLTMFDNEANGKRLLNYF